MGANALLPLDLPVCRANELLPEPKNKNKEPSESRRSIIQPLLQIFSFLFARVHIIGWRHAHNQAGNALSPAPSHHHGNADSLCGCFLSRPRGPLVTFFYTRF